MERGDIILYSGTGIFPWLIKKVTGSQWSHVVWVLSYSSVIESDASNGGVIQSPLTKYINPKNILKGKIKILRIKHISKEDLNAALLESISKIGHRYDYTSIAYLAWRYFLGIFGKKIKVSQVKENRDTCVELIALPLMHHGWTCFDDKSVHETTPGDFDLTNKTQEII